MPGKKILLSLTNSSKEELLQNVYKEYGRRKTPEETAFVEEIGKKIDRKLILLFLIALWVGIVSHWKIFMIQFKYRKISRCVVPELEGHFSFEQILNLSVRVQDDEYEQYCYYDNRNYKEYIQKYGYNYSAIMTAISEADNAYSLKCTKNIVTKVKAGYDDLGPIKNFHDQTNLYCKSTDMKRMAEISLNYGQLILSIPLGIVADFYGRRTAFRYSAVIFAAGIIFTSSFSAIMVIFGRFLIGSNMILFYTVFVILIESSSVNRRRFAFILHESIAIGRFLEYSSRKRLGKWTFILIFNTVMCLLILVWCFLFHESARWLYFRGKQQEAYRIIGIKKPEAPNTFIKKKMGSHLQYFIKPVFRKRLLIHVIIIWCTSSVVYLIRTNFSDNIKSFILKELLDSGALLGCCTLLTFFFLYFTGRRSCILLYFLVTSFVNSILFFNAQMDQTLNHFFLVVSVTLTENATFLVFYMISESYPNDLRFTGYGFCCGINGFGNIFHFHIMSHNIPVKSSFYASLFLLTSVSLASSLFHIDFTGPFILSDFPRESLRESDFRSILKNSEYKKNHSDT